MISPVTTIAKNTLIESVRQPVFLVIVLVAGLLQVLNTWITGFSMGYRRVPGEVTGDDKLLLDVGLSTVFVCGMLLAAFIATSAISREIENKTILTVVSKPIGRTSVILGKYLGISGALSIAIYLMLLGLLLGIRHGVLSTAADDPDQPVIIFSMLAMFGSLFIAAITNFMYGWQFGQTTIVAMVPLLTLAFFGVLLIDEDWKFQAITTDLKPQIMLAGAGMTIALMVLAAVATAASTRLGQVMTITVCAGVFVLGLLSNHFVGRYAYLNTPIGEIEIVEPGTLLSDSLADMGAVYRIAVPREYTAELAVGDPLYYGAAPNGVGMSVPDYSPDFDASTLNLEDTRWPEGTPNAIVITDVDRDSLVLTVKNVGNPPVAVRVPPQPGNFLFTQPTEVNPWARTVWGVVPNMQVFWLIDAVSQARPIPPSHVGLIALYGLSQIIGLLAIAVLLFQTRDVG
ncbi:MAG: ABC-2 type transport system permease protein [Phycisphaerales bacterium]|jgi:ABC-2 type transport system permease protein